MSNDNEKKKDNIMKEIWIGNKTFFIIIISLLVVGIGSIALWFGAIRPYIEKPQTSVKYSLVRSDGTWKQVPLSSKLSQYSVNRKQYVLQDSNGKMQECISFTGKGASPKHEFKSVLSFGDAKSRNYVLQQYPVIRMGVKSGYIKADFCFLQTDNEFSVLAVEALAESDFNDNSKTWDVLYDLMLTDTSSLKTTDERANAIITVLSKDGTAKVAGKPQITEQSLRNGTFYQWGYSMSESQRVDAMPAVMVDSKVLNSKVGVFDPDAMWKYIRHL
jgi:hypothetical protein